jgi:hypothetical protein
MSLPSVLGMPAAEARQVLVEAGCEAVVQLMTGPPRGWSGPAVERVVRQQATGSGQVTLTLARFMPDPGEPEASA